jgi:hypothetical protein
MNRALPNMNRALLNMNRALLNMNTTLSKASNGIITPLQSAFLKSFFETAAGSRFFLTGGTALAGFHLHHRLSRDLDLFTLDDDALATVDREIQGIAAQLGCHIGRARREEHLRQFLLVPQEDPDASSLQVDMVRDFGPQFGRRETIDGIIVDAIENIGANKINAILGRTESKDFVDLYFILEAGHDFDDLFAKAQQKAPGLLEFFFAGALLQVNRLTLLPEMRKSLDLPTMQAFFIAIANRMMDRLNPDGYI